MGRRSKDGGIATDGSLLCSLHLDGEERVYPEGCRGFPSGSEDHPLPLPVTGFDALCCQRFKSD